MCQTFCWKHHLPSYAIFIPVTIMTVNILTFISDMLFNLVTAPMTQFGLAGPIGIIVITSVPPRWCCLI